VIPVDVPEPVDGNVADIMHGPAVLVEGKKRKSYLIAFLDDHSRLIPHAEFYLSERLDSYLDALRKALRKRGLPRKLYVDNGSALRARLLEEITANNSKLRQFSEDFLKSTRNGNRSGHLKKLRCAFLFGSQKKVKNLWNLESYLLV